MQLRRRLTKPLLYSSVSRSQNVTVPEQLFFIIPYFFSAMSFVLLFDGFFIEPVKTILAS